MSKLHSTTATPTDKPVKRQKPEKPTPDFPLTAHPAGYWCKKIRGKVHYFGPWENPDGALQNYLRQKDALHSGRTPRPDPQALTVKSACSAFLVAKQASVDAKEMNPRTWRDYKDVCDLLVDHFGKHRLVSDLGPEDFSGLRNHIAQQWGPVRVGNTIQRVRTGFRFVHDAELIDRAVRFGPGFKRPSEKTLRIDKVRKGAKLFAADEVRRLLDAAGAPMKAMLLLGINCGFDNADCGHLPLSAVDLDARIIDFPRPKTGIPRRCPLWPETVQAIRKALAWRPEPKNPDHAGLVFVTKYGLAWVKDTPDSPVAKETAKLLKQLGITGRSGRGFYTLRHTFRTVAEETKDQPAADYIMGHEVPHISSIYRETISDDRLRAVSDHVRN